ISTCGQNPDSVTLQQAYNASTNPELTLDGTRGALTIRDASSPLGANLLEVQDNGGSTNYFAVTASGISTSGNLSVTGTSIFTGAATFNNNISQSGSGTLSTGTGAVSLNGATSVT